MGNTSENRENRPQKEPSRHLCLGILAHVDAGKTTLAESILYLTGGVRRLGRVDHQDAFLDTDALERARGITIFSKQAEVKLPNRGITLLDTPGHVDFSAEMERTLQVLDYAVLVISGADGVQSHVETLWRLLKRYRIPAFLFVNKMDQPGTKRAALLAELKKKLDENCIDFSEGLESETALESLAMCDEAALETFLETGRLETEQIAALIAGRKAFPVYFGSALRTEGVQGLLEGLDRYTQCPSYPEEFGARVFKIARDGQGKRLTYLKVTGGRLRVRQLLRNHSEEGKETWEEKADQLRIYSGADFTPVQEVEAGRVCAVTGLSKTFAGQGLGRETEPVLPVLEPVLTYRIGLPEGCDVHRMLLQLKALEEEEPQLHILWEESSGEIHAQVMGEVQIEILQSQIAERFGVPVSFGEGSIVYKETLRSPVEGVGHFEPLRHYAEVHLWMEPLERGSGLQFASSVSEDVLDRNWQRLVLTHLEERRHPGVLTGSEITDLRITLVAGRAHLKHTEGGDFRQATYRAVRQGLMSGESLLLEPVYEFRLEVPMEQVGRAMADIRKMQGSFAPPETEGEMALLAGTAPVATMRGYQTELTAYSRGRGRLYCTLKGYAPCHNAEEVIAARGYDPGTDTANPADSVFCAHGAGFLVPWDRVPDYMHLESPFSAKKPEREQENAGTGKRGAAGFLPEGVSEEELEEIFNRTYGASKRERYGFERPKRAERKPEPVRPPKRNPKEKQEEYLLVDGYNIIFAWEDLRELAQIRIESARDRLMDILCNYQGYCSCVLILVFDAYRVPGNPGSVQRYHNIDVVYTKEAETADQYIEKTAHAIGRQHRVTVATSDALEQMIIFGQGARRLSARELREEVERVEGQIRVALEENRVTQKRYLFDQVPREMAEWMEDVRQGRRTLEGGTDAEKGGKGRA